MRSAPVSYWPNVAEIVARARAQEARNNGAAEESPTVRRVVTSEQVRKYIAKHPRSIPREIAHGVDAPITRINQAICTLRRMNKIHKAGSRPRKGGGRPHIEWVTR
jgi:hypothetical protein